MARLMKSRWCILENTVKSGLTVVPSGSPRAENPLTGTLMHSLSKSLRVGSETQRSNDWFA